MKGLKRHDVPQVLPALGKAMGGAEFSPHFATLLPLFAKKTKKSASVAERSFSYGTLAEVGVGSARE